MFGYRLFIKCDQEQPKRTTIKTHGDLILSSANLAGYDLVLYGCRDRIILKFGREALYNFWQRLPKFQAKSSKFIFMTGMNLVHSLNQKVIWLHTFFRYVWQSIIYRMRPRIAQTVIWSPLGDLISKVSQNIHDPHQIWSSFAWLPASDSSKIWQGSSKQCENDIGKVSDTKLKIHFYDWNELSSFSQESCLF